MSAETRAVRTPGLSNLEEIQPPQGQFEIDTTSNGQRWFYFVCPGKCKALGVLTIRPVVNGFSQSWEWDGNEDAPTLTPSINHVGCWHGWLTAGVFKEC